jgi:hypothetical protein
MKNEPSVEWRKLTSPGHVLKAHRKSFFVGILKVGVVNGELSASRNPSPSPAPFLQAMAAAEQKFSPCH